MEQKTEMTKENMLIELEDRLDRMLGTRYMDPGKLT